MKMKSTIHNSISMMAFACFGRFYVRGRNLFQRFHQNRPNLRNFNSGRFARSDCFKCLSALTGGLLTYAYLNWNINRSVHALNMKKIKDEEKAVKLTARERRFIKFSSVEFDGQLYMTPQDFLDSVVEQEPRPRLKRKVLSLNDINKIKDVTPSLKKGCPNMFRSLRDKADPTEFRTGIQI